MSYAVRLLLLTLCVLSLSTNEAFAAVKKKVIVEPFQNPSRWAGSFDPGALLTEVVKRKITVSGGYRIVSQMPEMKLENAPAEMTLEKMDGSGKEEKEEIRRPGQAILSGRILTARSETLASGKGKKQIVEERMEMEVEVMLLSPKSNRVIAVKNIKADAKREKQADSGQSKTPGSVGAAVEALANDIYAFFNEALGKLPFEADIVAVDEARGEVIINVGANDGVRVFESFKVYFPTRYYRDPLNHADLGDLLTLTGTIKTEDVQEDIARAKILAGVEIKTGNLIREKQFTAGDDAKPWWVFSKGRK